MASPNPTSHTHAMIRLSPALLLRPDLRLPSSHARATTRLLTPTPIKEPVLAARPTLTSRRRHPSRRPIPQRRPHRRLRPSSLPLPLMRLRAPQITSRRLLLPRPEIPQRRTRPLPRRRPPPLPLPFMFLRALKTAPRPLPPPLAWLWVPPTESRRSPLPRPRMSPLTSLLSPPMALLMTHTLPLPLTLLAWMSTRLLHPPPLPHANGRVAVSTTERPKMNASANAGRLSSSPRRATRRRAHDPQGRLPTRQGTGASGGAGSGVVDVRSALPPTAVHAPSLAPLIHRSLSAPDVALGAAQG